MTPKSGAVKCDGEPCKCGWKPPAIYRVMGLHPEEGCIIAPIHPDCYLLELYCPNCNTGLTLMSETTIFDPSTAIEVKEEKELDDVSLN